MKSILSRVASALVLLCLPVASSLGLEVRYVNSTTTTTSPSITAAPTYCGGCQLIYEVHASVWWPIVYTDYIATWVYTVDKGSGSTIASSLSTPPNATAIQDLDYDVNFTSVYKLRDGGAVQYTYLNTLANGPLTTIIQYNEITMNASDYRNGYVASTLFYNDTLASTVCKGGYFTKNGNTGEIDLPSSTQYSYTTVVPFTDGYNMSNVITYGIDSLASYVATHLNLTIPACTPNAGGGVGTLKVGVTQLTSTSIFFAQAQVEPTPSPTPSPQPTPTSSPSPPNPPVTSSPPTGPSPSPRPPQPPQSPPSPPPSDTPAPQPSPSTEPEPEPAPEPTKPTAPPNPPTTIIAPPAPSDIVSVTSIIINPTVIPPADEEEATDLTTIVTVIQGTTRTLVVPVDEDGNGQIATTITSVTTGLSGIQTLIQTTEIPVGSYIASIGGINGSPEDTPSTTAISAGGNASSASPLEFEAKASLRQRSLILVITATFLLIAVHL